MGNWFAYIAIGIWPIVAVWLFRTKPMQEATLWTILGGHMFLPVGTAIDFSMIPPLDKASIPALAAFIGCRFIAGKRIPIFGQNRLVSWLLLLYIVGPFITAELNDTPVIQRARFLPGMTHYDALSAVAGQFIVFIPFFIGRQFFRTYENQLLMFRTLVLASLGYSVLMLFEIRMSPQLHTWIYGYFPHSSFGQQVRYGGFRPVVFMGHGLLVSFFAAIALISATVLWQLKYKIRRFSPANVTYYLMLILVLCKSAASILYGFFALLLIKITKVKTQLRIAVILASMALLYPTMSIMNIFPHQPLLELVRSIDTERAESMGVRFENERILLEHGRKNSFFGWGSWGRNRVYDVESGKDVTLTDGLWVITFSQFGWAGFIAEFGLLAIPVFSAKKAASKLANSHKELIMLAAHALLASLIIIDQLPNSSLAPWLWLLVGILLGRSEAIIRKHREEASSNRALLQ